MPTWPTSLPQHPLVGTLEISSEPNVSEFKADVFSNMIRARRYTAKAYTYNAALMLYTHAERDILEDFFSDDCADGVLPFDMTDWDGSGNLSTFQWIQPPIYSHIVIGVWRAAVQLIKIPVGGT
jgi:hypothetical protein